MALIRTTGSTDTVWIAPSVSICDRIVGYFQRTDDRRQVRETVIQRYGIGIRINTDPAKNRIETYTREGFAERVYAGTIEAISIGYGHLISGALGQLFGDSSRFELSLPGGGDSSAELERLVEYRSAGGFDSAIPAADILSVQIGSALLLIEWYDGHPRYRALDPGRLQACYSPVVVDDGSSRLADTADLEDALCVVIRTGSIDGIRHHYLAVIGESDIWPHGRYCTYTATGDGRVIPLPGTPGCVDYYRGTDLANPLTLYAQDHPEQSCPEYPVVVLRGGYCDTGDLCPVSTSLWSESLDADVAASHLRSTSQDAARGTLALSRTAEAVGHPLPRSLHGAVDLAPGMSIEHLSHDAAASREAWTVLQGELVQLAQAWGVPDFLVSSEDHTVEAASGVALEVRARPLRAALERRRAANAPAVRKIWEIERALGWMFGAGSAAEMARWSACGQTWEYLGLELPSNPAEVAERVERLVGLGVYDTISAIREIYGYSTDAEAIAEYERMRARALDYPPPREGDRGDI